MSNGYFSLPRSLTRDPLWINLPPAYRDVFIIILDHICFKPQKFDDHGVIIELLPGQVCASEGEILRWCGKHAKKNEIERSVKKLILCQFLRREVRHRKSIFTITHSDTYELILRGSEVGSEVNLRQTRGRKEEREERKEEKLANESELANPDKVDPPKKKKKLASCGIHFSRETLQFSGISTEDRDAWQKVYPKLNLDQEFLEMRTWLMSIKGQSRQGTRSFIDKWLKQSEMTRMSTQPKIIPPKVSGEILDTSNEESIHPDFLEVINSRTY
jgi:hypothetical protein